jgi:hypothetical protein
MEMMERQVMQEQTKKKVIKEKQVFKERSRSKWNWIDRKANSREKLELQGNDGAQGDVGADGEK